MQFFLEVYRKAEISEYITFPEEYDSSYKEDIIVREFITPVKIIDVPRHCSVNALIYLENNKSSAG